LETREVLPAGTCTGFLGFFLIRRLPLFPRENWAAELIHIPAATCYKEGMEAVVMLRFSLLALLGVVLVAAIGSAALANPTNTWRQVIVTGTVVILLTASSAAVVLRPGLQFSRGFAAAGWLYFVLAFGGVLGVQEHLLTEQASGWLGERIHRVLPSGYLVIPREANSLWYNFTIISRSFWTLILATIGGMFASWIGRRRDAGKSQTGELAES